MAYNQNMVVYPLPPNFLQILENKPAKPSFQYLNVLAVKNAGMEPVINLSAEGGWDRFKRVGDRRAHKVGEFKDN